MSLDAMKQALEALERGETKLRYEAITALRAAIEQAQAQEPVAWMHNLIEGNVITHRPADVDRHPERWTALYAAPPPCPTCEALARSVMMDQTSHDIAPRQWQGLTDEEIESMMDYWSDDARSAYGGAHAANGEYVYIPDIIRDAEKRLKEKNT